MQQDSRKSRFVLYNATVSDNLEGSIQILLRWSWNLVWKLEDIPFHAETRDFPIYEGWNFDSGNYLFTTDTKQIHVSKFYCPSM